MDPNFTLDFSFVLLEQLNSLLVLPLTSKSVNHESVVH